MGGPQDQRSALKSHWRAVLSAGCCSEPWLCAPGPGGTGSRCLGSGPLSSGVLRVGAGPLGLHQGEGRLVIESRDPIRAETGLEWGEAEMGVV